MQLSTDQEVVHTVVDAEENNSKRSLTIQPDRHGLTIKFEGNEDHCLTIDLCQGVFTVYSFDEAGHSKKLCIF